MSARTWEGLLNRIDWPLVTGVLVVLFVVMLTIYFWQKSKEEANDPSSTPGGLMSTFRQMYEDGELTQEEYERIKNRMRAGLRGAALSSPSPKSTASEPPTEVSRDNHVDRADPGSDS